MRKNFRFFSKMIVMMFLSVLVLENVSGEAYASEIQTEPEQNYIIAMEGIEEETSPEQSSPEAHTEELSEENNQKEGINTSYKITLNANGGYFSNEIDDLSGEYIEYAELITKVIYSGDSIDTEPLNNNGNSTSFVGWSFDQDGDIEIQSRESFYPINNCTLYAVWDIKPNTLNSEDSYDLIESNRQEIVNLFNTEDYDDEIILQKSEENELDQLTEIESADIPEPEELNNDTYNSSTQNDVFSEKIEAFEGIQNDSDLQSLPQGYDFDEDTHTLTLTDFTGEESLNTAVGTVQVYVDGDLNIVLNGSNQLLIESDYGIYCEGNLRISGNGSLNIANISTGIYAGHEIIVEQADVSIEDATAGIVANYGDVTIANASITMNNRIRAKNGGDFRMNGGNVVASHIECSDFILDSGNITAAIKTTGSIEVKDGIIDATSKNDNYDGIYFGIESSGNSIVIKGGELYTNCSYSLSAIEAPHADMTVSGGLINAEGSWSGVSLRSFSMSEGETAITCNEGSGIVCPVNVTGGRLTIDVKDARGNSGGIEGGLSLEGGNVSISSSTAGIIGETTVNGGELVVNSGTYGLYGYGSKAFVFNGGECWITGKEQAAYPITGLSLEIAMELLTGASNVNEEIAEEYLGEKYIHLLEKTSGLDIKKATIEIIPDQIFSGIANRPTLTVKYGKKVLQNNSDYITSYKDNISYFAA